METAMVVSSLALIFFDGGLAVGWILNKPWRRHRLRAARKVGNLEDADLRMRIESGQLRQENKILKQQLGLSPERRIALYSEAETVG
jgi:hypothetical protein